MEQGALPSRESVINFLSPKFGFGTTNFGVLQSVFVLESANKAEAIYLSRFKKPKILLSENNLRDLELVYVAALLSGAALYNTISYDDIAEFAGPEVASYLFLVNPDLRAPRKVRLHQLMTNLGSSTNLAKLIVFARVIAAITLLDDDASKYCKRKGTLWELGSMLKMTNCITHWSQMAADAWDRCRCTVEAWFAQKLMSDQPLSEQTISMCLDFTRRQNDVKQLFECV